VGAQGSRRRVDAFAVNSTPRAEPGHRLIATLAGLVIVASTIVASAERSSASDGFGNEWVTSNTTWDRCDAWQLTVIPFEAAHQAGYTGAGVRVAVIEQIIPGEHPAFEDRVVEYVSASSGDENLTVGTTPFVPPAGSDDHRIGEHPAFVAGIIAAQEVNGNGIVGGAPDVEIVAMGLGGVSSSATAAQWAHYMRRLESGFRRVVDLNTDTDPANDIDLVNVSLGLQAYDPWSLQPRTFPASLEATIDDVFDSGALVIAGAGNDGPGDVTVPARYDSVVAVGMVDVTHNETGALGYATQLSSSTGPEVDLAAPGGGLRTTAGLTQWAGGQPGQAGITTYPAGGYGYRTMAGTSMAAPQVVAAAALLLDIDPTLTPSELRTKLIAAAAPHATVDPAKTGAGVIDLTVLFANEGITLPTRPLPAPCVSTPAVYASTLVDGQEKLVNSTTVNWGRVPAVTGAETVTGYTITVNPAPADGSPATRFVTQPSGVGEHAYAGFYPLHGGVRHTFTITPVTASGAVGFPTTVWSTPDGGTWTPPTPTPTTPAPPTTAPTPAPTPTTPTTPVPAVDPVVARPRAGLVSPTGPITVIDGRVVPLQAPATGTAGHPITASSQTATGAGAWTADSSGRIYTTGDAPRFGDLAELGVTPNRPINGMAPTPTGRGYWMVASDGGIFSFGDAVFYGSTGAMTLNRPIVAMTPTPTGNGYWLVASDGGIFAYGDAVFYGSTGGMNLNSPINGMAATPTGRGYWLFSADGGIFAYGDAAFHGSLPGTPAARGATAVGMIPTPDNGGYWIVTGDNRIFGYGTAN
jgi:subtilisin family serine protease